MEAETRSFVHARVEPATHALLRLYYQARGLCEMLEQNLVFGDVSHAAQE